MCKTNPYKDLLLVLHEPQPSPRKLQANRARNAKLIIKLRQEEWEAICTCVLFFAE